MEDDDHEWLDDLLAFAMHFNLTCSRKRTYYFGLFNYWIGRPNCITVPISSGLTTEYILSEAPEPDEPYQKEVASYIVEHEGTDFYNVVTDAVHILILQ